MSLLQTAALLLRCRCAYDNAEEIIGVRLVRRIGRGMKFSLCPTNTARQDEQRQAGVLLRAIWYR